MRRHAARGHIAAITLALGVVAVAPTASAQEDFGLDLFRPRVAVNLDAAQKREFKDSSGTFGTTGASLTATIPLGAARVKPTGDPRMFQMFTQVHAGTSAPKISFLARDHRLYTGGASLAGVWLSQKRNFYYVSLGTSFAEDDATIHRVEPRFALMAVASARRSDTFSWLYGAAFAYTFGRGLAFPVLGARWRLSDEWTLQTILPLSVNARWRANADVRVDLHVGVVGGRSRFANDGEYPGAASTLALRQTHGSLDGGVEFKVSRDVALAAHGGVLVGGKLAIEDDGHELVSRKFSRNAFVRLSARYIFGRPSLDIAW